MSPGLLMKRPRAEREASGSGMSTCGGISTSGSNATTTRESFASAVANKKGSISSGIISRSIISTSTTSTSAQSDAGAGAPPTEIMLAWRARVNVQFAVTERRLVGALDAAGLSAQKQRAHAATLMIMLLVACPDTVDVQVAALAMLYLDRFTCLGGVAAPTDPAAARTLAAAEYYHAAAACAALALKWFRLTAADDVVGNPSDGPERFNRLIEVFQVSRSVRLTPARLGAIQMRVCTLLGFDMWMGTAADWIALARNTNPCAVACDCAECGCVGGETVWPPMCWPQRQRAEVSEDMLPRAIDTATALARLPLEERVLLHALREPALVAWTPCRLGTACLTLAAACGAPGLPSPARIEATRVDTMPGQRGARCPTTAKDVVALHAMLVARAAAPAADAASVALSSRLPPPFAPHHHFDPAALARSLLLACGQTAAKGGEEAKKGDLLLALDLY
jgi:hypothetical protein